MLFGLELPTPECATEFDYRVEQIMDHLVIRDPEQ